MPDSNRRSFCRFPIDLPATVRVRDADGRQHLEQAILQDVSGGGLRFGTRHADRYARGREVDITVDMPPAGEVRAQMTARGRVVRTIPDRDSGGVEVAVAVILESPLHFSREK